MKYTEFTPEHRCKNMFAIGRVKNKDIALFVIMYIGQFLIEVNLMKFTKMYYY